MPPCPPTTPVPSPTPSTLHRLAAERATGSFTRAGGTLFLVDGHIVHAESSAATGLEILLGRGCALTRACWEAAMTEAGRDGGGTWHLVASGRVPAGVLELCRGVALYDAAFFVLAPGGGPGRFRHGVRHWLGACGGVVPLVVERETARRLAFLDRIWPDARLDVLPPVPAGAAAPRGHPADPAVWTGGPPRGAQPHPTGRQERSAAAPVQSSRLRAVPDRQLRILELADGNRTATDIARALGRPAFHTLVELRRLAAAGLVAPAPHDRSAAGAPDRYPRPGGRYPDADARAATGGAPPAGPLGPVFAEPDIALLRRLRDALEAL
ncbi:transcriptional regulator [Streptomyces qinglanensis]|uniref:transcriptional regulator n=1 Tax=Streptomyces qinglanensis TaxID=943816 RepID=UPI003D743B70